MTDRINMNLINTQGETLLAAADSNLLGRELREGILHLKVIREFYGDVIVSRDTFISSLRMCTIANLVGEKVVKIAIMEGFVDEENIIYIEGVPHAQFATLQE
ncbi:MAG TPA: DUF424 family protein [Thermoplasmataceae archaeon]|nr:DUF424 family protein [Thermoplasmataceae archaeon]